MPNRSATSAVLRIVKYGLLIVVCVLFVTAAAFRIQSYLFARKVHSVLEQMAKLQLQKTSKEEILTLLPELEPGTLTGLVIVDYSEAKCPGDGCYRFVIRNWPNGLLGKLQQKMGYNYDWLYYGAYLLGHRFRGFEGYVETREGRISRYEYLLFIEYREFAAIEAVEVHVMGSDRESFPGHFGFIQSYDEIENFKIKIPSNKRKEVIYVAFTPEAQPGDVKSAFDVHLECAWHTLGCSMTKQVLPILWKEKIEPGENR